MKTFLMVLGFLVLAFIISLLTAWPIMLLWNACLVPAVTFAKEIDFWQAFGIMLLCSFLFKSYENNSNKGE